MADDHNYSLAEPFGIDHGELDGLTPQEVFALGVEWQLFRYQLEHPEAIENESPDSTKGT